MTDLDRLGTKLEALVLSVKVWAQHPSRTTFAQYDAELGAVMDYVRGAESRALRAEGALEALFALVEDGTLVRDTSRDAEPGWALRQLPLVQALSAARAALSDRDAGGGTP